MRPLQLQPGFRSVALCLLRVPAWVCRFFRQAKDADYLKRMLLAGLPPLPQRCMEIRMVSAAGLQDCAVSCMQAWARPLAVQVV